MEDADVFDEIVPATQGETADEEPEKVTTQIKHQIESPTFSDVYAPEVIARITPIKLDPILGRLRQTLNRTKHPPMERWK